MSEGVNSTVGDRATGKLMSHIKALQEQGPRGQGLKLLSETMLAEQARLREEAEEAKFYRDEAAKRWEDAEDLAGQLHQQLSRARIDPGRELMDRMRNRPKALTDASPSSSARSQQQVNGAAVPPEHCGDSAKAVGHRGGRVAADGRDHAGDRGGGDGDGERGAGVAEERDLLAQAASGRGVTWRAV